MIVCSCFAVSSADVEELVQDGADTVAAVSAACRAGTDCGYRIFRWIGKKSRGVRLPRTAPMLLGSPHHERETRRHPPIEHRAHWRSHCRQSVFYSCQDVRKLGYHRLAEHIRKESIDEMKHADKLIERILFLEGVPNVQRLSKITIGQRVADTAQARSCHGDGSHSSPQ
jgi:hypothetical protein